MLWVDASLLSETSVKLSHYKQVFSISIWVEAFYSCSHIVIASCSLLCLSRLNLGMSYYTLAWAFADIGGDIYINFILASLTGIPMHALVIVLLDRLVSSKMFQMTGTARIIAWVLSEFKMTKTKLNNPGEFRVNSFVKKTVAIHLLNGTIFSKTGWVILKRIIFRFNLNHSELFVCSVTDLFISE